jgi:phage gp29-like protein
MTTKPDTTLAGRPSALLGGRTVVGHVDVDTLTPRAIKRMLLAAESGDVAAQSELFERMEEKDGELDAYLRTRKAAVARLRHQVQPADSSQQAAYAADLCREALQAVEGLPQSIFDLLDAIPKGFSAMEIDWDTATGRWLPRELLWRPQRWFTVADDGLTLRLRAETPGESLALNPLNWVVHKVKARSGFCARTSLLRSCVRAFVVRHFAWKDWLAFAEVYGMPPRVGWLREGVPWDSDEARELFQAVRSLGMDAAAVMREGNRIEMLDTRGAGDGQVFDRLIERAGRELTLAILGQLLTSGGESGGSYALGQVHNQVRWDLIEADALALERTLTTQLLRPIVRLNLGEDYPIPRLRFDTDKPEDHRSLAETVRTLSQAGLPIPAEWAYEKFGIPKPTQGQAVFGPGGKETTSND